MLLVLEGTKTQWELFGNGVGIRHTENGHKEAPSHRTKKYLDLRGKRYGPRAGAVKRPRRARDQKLLPEYSASRPSSRLVRACVSPPASSPALLDDIGRGSFDAPGVGGGPAAVHYADAQAAVVAEVAAGGGDIVWELSKHHEGVTEKIEIRHGEQTMAEAVVAMSILLFARRLFDCQLDAVYTDVAGKRTMVSQLFTCYESPTILEWSSWGRANINSSDPGSSYAIEMIKMMEAINSILDSIMIGS
ncbi:hypothetical protein C8R44DRAFT_738580 [Mycena epipterygia]|nr:hypothetical protein C8R44DRAFT_738580 [Mycena epipterygia]